MEPDWQRCDDIARHHGRTFYFASRCLPRAQRQAVVATYAYCRIADDIVDNADGFGRHAALRDLDAWENEIANPTHPVGKAFAVARDRFHIPEQPVHDLITGVRMDLATSRYGNWEELRSYCYHVAGTVGLMVAPILGCQSDAALTHAADLGIAMQLTNILRDVGEDARHDRLYLPLDEIAAFGCTENAILAGAPESGFVSLMEFQIERARSLYAGAHRGIPALDVYGRFTTLVASDLYARILSEIEANQYDVFERRAHCSTKKKILAIPRISARFMRTSLYPPPTEFVPLAPQSGGRGARHATPSHERRTYG
ncbi:MAG: phytoene/squalene synthase family protein [Thermomicrobiales bacterium]